MNQLVGNRDAKAQSWFRQTVLSKVEGEIVESFSSYEEIHKCSRLPQMEDNIATQAFRKQEYESQNVIELLGKLSEQHIVVVQKSYDLFWYGKSLCVAICQRCK